MDKRNKHVNKTEVDIQRERETQNKIKVSHRVRASPTKNLPVKCNAYTRNAASHEKTCKESETLSWETVFV